LLLLFINPSRHLFSYVTALLFAKGFS